MKVTCSKNGKKKFFKPHPPNISSSRGPIFKVTNHVGWFLPENVYKEPFICIVYGAYIEDKIARQTQGCINGIEELQHHSHEHHNAYWADHYARSSYSLSENIPSSYVNLLTHINDQTRLALHKTVKLKIMNNGSIAIYDSRDNILYGNPPAAKILSFFGQFEKTTIPEISSKCQINRAVVRSFIKKLAGLSLIYSKAK